jgi:hypothetical protein
MATQGDDNHEGPRKPYAKPRIVRVLLRPEEAVLGSCKNANKRGPLKQRCTQAGNCSTIGS